MNKVGSEGLVKENGDQYPSTARQVYTPDPEYMYDSKQTKSPLSAPPYIHFEFSEARVITQCLSSEFSSQGQSQLT